MSDLIGPLTAPPRDLSGGAWRAEVLLDEAAWPASSTFTERSKHLLPTSRGPVLAKWAGLGAEAHDKAERGRRLAEAQLSPPVLALRDGWLLQRWVKGRPLGPEDSAPLAGLEAGLRLRAAWPAPDPGASAEVLAEMARVNAGEALGSAAGERAAARVTASLAGPAPPAVWIDGRLHRHEWIRTPDGRTLKTDALDHARAHDLVGAQEIGWDVAGAAVEWALAPEVVTRLAAAAGAPAHRLPGLTTAYLAFQLGAFAQAAASHEHNPPERDRLRREQDRYAHRLARELAAVV